MKHIPLPTDTPEQRAIIKALTLQQGDDGIWLHISNTRFSGSINLGKQPQFIWESIKEFLGDEKSIRLDWLSESTKEESSEVPSCICGFDAEGWREYTGTNEVICDGDEFRTLKDFHPVDESVGQVAKTRWDLILRTRRRLPDCPCVKKAPASEIAGEGMSESRHEWWCNTCKKTVPPDMVTFNELHDERFGGCGNSVISIQSASPQTSENQPHEADAQKSAECGGDGKLDLSGYINDIHAWGAANTTMQLCEALRKIESHANGGK